MRAPTKKVCSPKPSSSATTNKQQLSVKLDHLLVSYSMGKYIEATNTIIHHLNGGRNIGAPIDVFSRPLEAELRVVTLLVGTNDLCRKSVDSSVNEMMYLLAIVKQCRPSSIIIVNDIMPRHSAEFNTKAEDYN